MGPIILDVSHKDLYSSWENFCQTTIDDFKLSNVRNKKKNIYKFIYNLSRVLFQKLIKLIGL